MKLSALMTVNAIVAVVFGVAMVLVPGLFVSLYGVEETAALNYVAQLLGAAFILQAVLSWSARNAAESDARRAIVLALFFGNAIGFVLALIGQLGNVVGALGWSTVALYLLFGLGYGYFQFVKPASQETPSFAE